MATDAKAPDTIVLVHGLWMTPRSWEAWVHYYEDKGFKVLTPTYPGFEVEVEALREDPTPIATATVPATVAGIAEQITELDTPPIIIGHSFGGTLTQLLLDRGCGAAGVAIDSAPTEGVRVNPLSQIRSLFPALKDPRNRHRAFGFTLDEFHYAFTNTLSEEESRKVYDRYHIPAPGNWIWAYGLIARAGRRSSSSAAARTTSCPRRCRSRTPSTTRATRSPSTTSSRAATTGRAAPRAGRRSPTTLSSGRSRVRPAPSCRAG
jgi:pimeloyl-ACP methyl ester carboxylesterase